MSDYPENYVKPVEYPRCGHRYKYSGRACGALAGYTLFNGDTHAALMALCQEHARPFVDPERSPV